MGRRCGSHASGGSIKRVQAHERVERAPVSAMAYQQVTVAATGSIGAERDEVGRIALELWGNADR